MNENLSWELHASTLVLTKLELFFMCSVIFCKKRDEGLICDYNLWIGIRGVNEQTASQSFSPINDVNRFRNWGKGAFERTGMLISTQPRLNRLTKYKRMLYQKLQVSILSVPRNPQKNVAPYSKQYLKRGWICKVPYVNVFT